MELELSAELLYIKKGRVMGKWKRRCLCMSSGMWKSGPTLMV